MTITLDWTVIVGLVVWTALVFRLGRSMGGGEGRDLSGPPSHMVSGKPPVMPAAANLQAAALPPGAITPARMEAIGAALASGNKIMAIKLFREATGVGLAEAKAAVEAMER